MNNIGPRLVNSNCLHNDDYLVSPNGVFCAYLHDDGNFCIYNNPTPIQGRAIWQSGQTSPIGPHCAYLHDDGNLCIYPSEWPIVDTWIWHSKNKSALGPHCAYLHDDGNLCIYPSEWPIADTWIWQSGQRDPVEEIEQITSIVYDLQAGTIISSEPTQIYTQTVDNTSDIAQTSTISGNETVTETKGWSNSLGVKVAVTASASLACEVPLVASAKQSISLSLEVNNTYTWNGSTSQTHGWQFSTPITVPPHQIYKASILVTMSTISVPYILSATARLHSGALVPITIAGQYNGMNSHDLYVKYSQVNSDGTENLVSLIELPSDHYTKMRNIL